MAKHLKLLERQGLVRSWDDRQIGAGDIWKQAIDRNLQEADIILLLISADFLDSDYCFDVEMKTALERHAAGEALVIPIILRPVDWQASPFGALQALPRDGKPVTTFENVDIALQQVAAGIRAAIEKLLRQRRGEMKHSLVPPLSPRLSPECLDRIASLLSSHIGPIASVIVRRAASRCTGALELCQTVAGEIADPHERHRFLKDAYVADQAGWPSFPTGAKPSAS